jgi:hypothetical protein
MSISFDEQHQKRRELPCRQTQANGAAAIDSVTNTDLKRA